jgi:hypothetical protein
LDAHGFELHKKVTSPSFHPTTIHWSTWILEKMPVMVLLESRVFFLVQRSFSSKWESLSVTWKLSLTFRLGVFKVRPSMENFWLVVGNPPLGPHLAKVAAWQWALKKVQWMNSHRGGPGPPRWELIHFSAHYQVATSARGHEVGAQGRISYDQSAVFLGFFSERGSNPEHPYY